MIKIINTDGIVQGTKVLNEDGNEIKYITRMTLDFKLDNYIEANIELIAPKVEVKALENYIYPSLEDYEKELERRWLK